MGYTIFITEKPSVAQSYREVLQVKKSNTNGYIEGYSPVLKKDVQITWAVGHLVSLGSVEEQKAGKVMSAAEMKSHKTPWKKENLPVFPAKDWVYKVNYQTKDQYAVIKQLYTGKDVDAIYYAGDSGREGIYIQALIRNQIFGNKKPSCEERVVWIDSFTEEAILKGIREAKPYEAYQPMIDSGYERAISDWLIGMNLTMAFTNTSGGLVTVGRVMTPTLAMVVNRQKEIDEFVPTDYYGINADTGVEKNMPKWKAKENSSFYTEDDLYNESGFLKEEKRNALVDDLSKDMSLFVEKVEKVEKKELAPLLYNLADIQAFGSKVCHIAPAKTLEIVQGLYEKKLVTYPRTDARVLSSAVADEIQQKTGKSVPKKYVNDAKITDHYAIIPTNYNRSGRNSLGGLEGTIYQAICDRFDAIFMPAYIYDQVTVKYVHKNGEEFYQSGKVIKQLGYRELWKEDREDFIAPKEKETVPVNEFVKNNMQTQAPSSYTTGTLILAMEKAGKLIEDEELREQIKTCGIGTSATRAGIIEKLADKEYITIDKKQKIAPTDAGKSIIPVVAKFDAQLVSPEKTADMEKHLSDVADGSLKRSDYDTIIREYIISSTNHILSENKEKITGLASKDNGNSEVFGKCPKCGGEIVKGKFGPYCREKCGIGFKIYGKLLTDKQIQTLLSGKSIKMKSGKYENTILPEVVANEYQGKTYYNFKVQ